MILILQLISAFISQAKALEYSVLTGIISHVRDGDTIEVGNIPVRIAALNCPENDTKEGQRASKFASQFRNSKVICDLTGAMSYKRLVGYCRINETDFATTMINNTSCKLWPKYDVWRRYIE